MFSTSSRSLVSLLSILCLFLYEVVYECMSYGVRRNRHAVQLLRTLIHLVGADVSCRDSKLLVMPDLNGVDDLVDTRWDRCYQPLVFGKTFESIHGCKEGKTERKKKDASIIRIH